MLELLENIIKIMIYMYEKYEINRPLDMFVVNYVIYKYYKNRIYQGNNFNTIFGHNEYDRNKVVKHK